MKENIHIDYNAADEILTIKGDRDDGTPYEIVVGDEVRGTLIGGESETRVSVAPGESWEIRVADRYQKPQNHQPDF